MKYNLIELVAPAGNSAALDAAISEGADAVYLGLRDFNARMRAKNFSYNQFDAIVDKLHGMGKRIYVTVNTIFEEWEKNRIYPLLKYLDEVGVDAVIVQDFGTIKLIRDNFPNLKITASTQLNIASSKAVNLLSKYNVKRVVLSRELSLDELKKIRNRTSAELEVFVHGSLCISYSGLCLFSSYYGGKSANRGKCTQACRRLYTADKGNKGYFFSPSDLMLIEHIPDLIEIGINSIKLEGRMKNSLYVGTIVRAYRHMIDNYQIDQQKTLRESLNILHSDYAREKTKYFFTDKNNSDFINLSSSGEIGLYIGTIHEFLEDGSALIKTELDLLVNDTLRFHNEDDKKRKSSKIMKLKKTTLGFYINVPEGFKINDTVYLIERKEALTKYPHIIPNSLSKYKRHPGISTAPYIKKRNVSNNILHTFKDGIYVKTNNFNDLYQFSTVKPEKVILQLNEKNSQLLKKNMNSLTFKPDEFILSLNSYFPAGKEDELSDDIKFFSVNGFNNFIANNPGQISLLKDNNVNIIAGPYLYTFNQYSIDFLMETGCSLFVSPLENNKKNLIETSILHPKLWFVTIFVYPELFQIKADLSKNYNFTFFNDNLENQFHLFAGEEGTTVIPEKPFSIIDKIPQLNKAGLNRFIVDLSFMKITKNYYKTIMKTVENKGIIETATRFNWKNGFYREDSSNVEKDEK
jgi:U32 family peptidase